MGDQMDASSLADWLRKQIQARKATAEAVSQNSAGRCWSCEGEFGPLVDGRDVIVVYYEGTPSDEEFQHIALNDPQDTIARCDAELNLLDDILGERHIVVDGDWWFTCPAATEERDGGTCDNEKKVGWPCDCGRDDRVERRIRIMASGYQHREGYPEEAT